MCQYWNSVWPSYATTATVSGRKDSRRTTPSRVAEEPADGVLAVERLDGPAVTGDGRVGGRRVGDEDSARENCCECGDGRSERPRPGAACCEMWVRGSHAPTVDPARNGSKTAASRRDNDPEPRRKLIRRPLADGGTNRVNAGISDPRPARGVG